MSTTPPVPLPTPKPTKHKDGEFGDQAAPAPAVRDPEAKIFTVYLRDGSEIRVEAFRMFASFDVNLGQVLTALRSDESIIGTYYQVQGWTLHNPGKWVAQS